MNPHKPTDLLLRAVLALCLLLPLSARADIPARPDPPRLVNDLAGLFTEAQREELEARLVALDDSTSNQLTVVTVKDLEGYDPDDYAVRIGLAWGVGGEKLDNGIVLLVKPKLSESDRGQVSIQVGYGLEGAIPDVYCKRIIENELIPRFRENDYYGGVASACDQLCKLASGEISEPREKEDHGAAAGLALFVGLLLFVFLLVLLSSKGDSSGGSSGTHGGSPIFFGPIGGRSHSSGSSFGGGFGGGGFGGFGGGSFGGGGASGSW